MNKKELLEELKRLGLSEEVLSGIEDDQLQGLVDKLKPKQIGFDEFLKDPTQQGEFDRRVSKALETAKKKKEDPKPDDPKIEVDGEQPKWVKTLLEQNKTLSEKMENLEKGSVVKSKKDQAIKFLKGTELPENLQESWLSRIDTDSETPIEDQVKALDEEYKGLVQNLADNTKLGGSPPRPGLDKDVKPEELDKYINV